jgi:hypothetical protein
LKLQGRQPWELTGERKEGGKERRGRGRGLGGMGWRWRGGRLGVAAGLCASVHRCSLLLAERRRKETGRRKVEER